MTERVIFATGAVLIISAILARFRALRAIQRAAINLRAVGLFVRLAVRAVYRERHQWAYCVAEARRDA